MDTIELKWDKILKIKTSGRDDSMSDRFHHPYEPTPYRVLERLANSGYLSKKDVLIDYGSGKGRTGLYLSYQLRMKTIGVEFDQRMHESSEKNKESAVSGQRAEFLLQSAESYEVPDEANRFYFFNPFPVEILKAVISRILNSYYAVPREMCLFFYYPSDEYISYLMEVDQLLFDDEIDCRDLYQNEDARERIMVFRIG